MIGPHAVKPTVSSETADRGKEIVRRSRSGEIGDPPELSPLGMAPPQPACVSIRSRTAPNTPHSPRARLAKALHGVNLVASPTTAFVARPFLIFVAAAFARQRLLGHMDLDTREWTDGVLTAAARKIVKEPPEVKPLVPGTPP